MPAPQPVFRRALLGLQRQLLARPVLSVFGIALAVRTAVAIGVAAWFDGFVFYDDATYFELARQLAEGKTATWDPGTAAFFNRTASFLIPLTLLFKALAPTPLVGLLLVGVFGAAAAAATTAVALQALPRRWALPAGLGVALLPSQVLFSSLMLKDALSWAILTAMALVVAVAGRTVGRRLVPLGAAVVVLLLLMAHVRAHTLVVMVWALMLSSFAGASAARIPRVLGAWSIGVLLPALIGLGPAGFSLVSAAAPTLAQARLANAYGAATALIEQPRPVVDEVDKAAVTRVLKAAAHARQVARELRADTQAVQAGGGEKPALRKNEDAKELAARYEEAKKLAAHLTREAARLQAEVIRSEAVEPEPEPAAAPHVRHLPKGLAAVLLQPFPWVSTANTRLQLARAENLLWYPLLALAALGIRRAWPHRRALAFPLLAGGGLVIMYALAEGNFGSAYRHRGEFVWVVALLAAVGLRDAAMRRRRETRER